MQHALRAFTPRDQKAVKAAATTFRANPAFDVEKVITELAVGEALVSFLDAKGTPGMVERAFIVPPEGHIGALTPEERAGVLAKSPLAGRYEKLVDRESAYERLKGRAEEEAGAAAGQSRGGSAPPAGQTAPAPRRARQPQSPGEAMARSAARAIGYQVGREIVRGVLGSLLGGGRRR